MAEAGRTVCKYNLLIKKNAVPLMGPVLHHGKGRYDMAEHRFHLKNLLPHNEKMKPLISAVMHEVYPIGDKITLSLAGISYIDASTVQMIVQLSSNCNDSGYYFELVDVSIDIYKMLKLTNLEKLCKTSGQLAFKSSH